MTYWDGGISSTFNHCCTTLHILKSNLKKNWIQLMMKPLKIGLLVVGVLIVGTLLTLRVTGLPPAPAQNRAQETRGSGLAI